MRVRIEGDARKHPTEPGGVRVTDVDSGVELTDLFGITIRIKPHDVITAELELPPYQIDLTALAECPVCHVKGVKRLIAAAEVVLGNATRGVEPGVTVTLSPEFEELFRAVGEAKR